jgi:thiol-disulfide isomerase/thioredoxin
VSAHRIILLIALMGMLRTYTACGEAAISDTGSSRMFGTKINTGLKLDRLDGSAETLSSYVQKGPVYVNFWALWCEPCKQELRAMKTLVNELPGDSFTLLAINLDSPKSLAKVRAFVRSQDYPFPIFLDSNEQLFRSFNGQFLPFALLIDRQGNVISTRTSFLPGDEKEIKEEILRVIGQ